MKKIYTLVLLAFISMNMMADQLTPAQALARLQGNAAGAKGTMATGNMTLAYTSKAGNLNSYYAFNNSQGGYVVLSADDCLPAVLVTSDGNEGSFDADNIPDGLRYWLGQYDAAVTKLNGTGEKATSLTSYEEIHPLLGLSTDEKKTAWGQEYPFNYCCPFWKGDGTHPMKISLTGCVAVATAQVMRYHQWPDKGEGQNSYTYTFTYINGTDTLTFDNQTESSVFSEHTYDWGSMLDSYTSNVTDAQKLVIGTLMHDVGVSVNMTYGTADSGTATQRAVGALVKNFKYDPSATFYKRGMFTDEEWENKIYAELTAKRPVIYDGVDPKEGGHAFVCDGYKDGLYHMNWGWYGQRNNYVYMVTTEEHEAIRPEVVEGMKDFSFSVGQGAIIGIKPYAGGTANPVYIASTIEPYIAGINDEGKDYVESTFSRNSFKNMVYRGRFDNCYYEDLNLAYALKATGENGTYILPYGLEVLKVNHYTYRTPVMVNNILKTGKYKITPIYKNLGIGDTEWKEIPTSPVYTTPEVTITGNEAYLVLSQIPVLKSKGASLVDGKVYKTNGEVSLDITASIQVVKDLETANPHSLYALIFEDGGSKSIASLAYPQYLTTGSVGATATLDYTNKYSLNNLEIGKMYYVVLVDYYGPKDSQVQDYMTNTAYNRIPFTVVDGSASGIEDVNANVDSEDGHAARKVLKNGKLVIERNGKEYSVDGKRL